MSRALLHAEILVPPPQDEHIYGKPSFYSLYESGPV